MDPPSPTDGGSRPAGKLQGKCVLVVENDADARELVARLLSRAGATVTAVASAAEALRALDASVPDVLVSDVAMPNEDGYSLIRRVRRRSAQRGGRVPALAVTAYASRADRLKTLEAGFHEHLAKPVEPEDLITRVAYLARAGEQHRRP